MSNKHLYNARALSALEPNAVWVMQDYDLDQLNWQDTKITKPANDVILAKAKELEQAYVDQDYARKRKAEYPSWRDQLGYIYDNGIDKWKTDIVDPVKKKYPKP